MNSRRHFIRLAACSGAALLAGREALAADPPLVDEKDPQAAALGYVADATKANKAKYPNYVAGQVCSNCQFYQGKAGTAAGPCPVLGGKLVAAKGWCSAYAKKVA
ncbi:MAG: high-potential iron-sulfur protein [Caldimonas sp.]